MMKFIQKTKVEYSVKDVSLLEQKLKSKFPGIENNKQKIQHYMDVLSNSQEFMECFFDNSCLDLSEDKKLKNPINIKLVVTDIFNSDVEKNIRSLVSPFLRKINKLPRYGMFHTAVIIGPWMIDWTDSSLIIPRRVMSKKALIVIDVGKIKSMDELDHCLDKVSSLIVKWNSEYKYSSKREDGCLSGNCQHFVDEILDCIGVDVNIEKITSDFIRRMCDNGYPEFKFEPNEKFRVKFGIKGITRFKTHEELDKFFNVLLYNGKCDITAFENEYPGEYNLLKSFDNAFWLRYNYHKHKNDETNIVECSPLEKSGHNGTVRCLLCPFEKI